MKKPHGIASNTPVVFSLSLPLSFTLTPYVLRSLHAQDDQPSLVLSDYKGHKRNMLSLSLSVSPAHNRNEKFALKIRQKKKI